jgi:CheY-like chemotaxis protein
MKPAILLVDNTLEALETASTILQQENYRIYAASTFEEAERVLELENVHLIVADIRMEDENSGDDESGLRWVAQLENQQIPKIIRTAYPSFETTRTSLNRPGGEPLAVDYVVKADGPEALLKSVQLALQKHVLINWDLEITWNGQDPYFIDSLIEPGLGDELRVSHAEEIQEIFRRLFLAHRYLRVARLLWHNDGRVALCICASEHGDELKWGSVIIGPREGMAREIEGFQNFTRRSSETSTTSLIGRAETNHFAACAYNLFAVEDISRVRSNTFLYRELQEESFAKTLEILFKPSISAWHQKTYSPHDSKSLEQLYVESLLKSEPTVIADYLTEHVRPVLQRAATLGLHLTRSSGPSRGRLIMQHGLGTMSLRDPIDALRHLPHTENPEVISIPPGIFHPDRVFFDAKDHVWFTDFAEPTLLPVLWAFVDLESKIRFDWLEMEDLDQGIEMEKRLVSAQFNKLDVEDAAPELRKALMTIQRIRSLAASIAGVQPRQYHVGIFFQALHRLTEKDPRLPTTRLELERLIHILLSAAMICSEWLYSDRS